MDDKNKVTYWEIWEIIVTQQFSESTYWKHIEKYSIILEKEELSVSAPSVYHFWF